MTLVERPPIRFCFGVHLHQPVGNFDKVFEQHIEDVYLPFLQRAVAADFFPIALHISGPLIEWMEAHDTRYLDLLGTLAASGKVELLLAGFYEPVLAVLPRQDRLEQIAWLRDALRARFGVTARGLWLTERVWESDLTADLHDAGVEFAIVDDRHFLTSGFERNRLHAPLRTENGGKRLALFAIDERLRYLIPFQPPEDTVAYLRALRDAGHGLAVLADDGEKFGGWPGTRDWVYTRGWLDRFFAAMSAAMEGGVVQLSTFGDALDIVPSGGLAYLGTASYREMEGWSLPAAAARLTALETELGDARMHGPESALVRGAHWRNFMVKYAEANRLHKKMLALSALCRAAGDPPAARRAIGRAQCNDAYWHGVFGGLYLPHLRDGVWRHLAIAERELRAGESLRYEVLDIDADGHDEIWIHSAHFSAILSPQRGGAVEEWTLFAAEVNVANTLTRRREAYHRVEAPALVADSHSHSHSSAPSIHDTEQTLTLTELPPVDRENRALLVDRVLPHGAKREAHVAGTLVPDRVWANTVFSHEITLASDQVTVVLRDADGLLEKTLTFTADGAIEAAWRWKAAVGAPDAWFATELSVARAVDLDMSPDAHEWRYDIETVAKSEKGLDRTRQGEAIVLAWRLTTGEARVRIRLAPEPTARAIP